MALEKAKNVLRRIIGYRDGADYIDVTSDTPLPVTGNIDIIETTGFNGGPITVGTSIIELTFTGQTQAIGIQSDHDNVGIIWVGSDDITNSGNNAIARIGPGESLDIDLNDQDAALYVISDTASQKVYTFALI